jgi:hypothetical protein
LAWRLQPAYTARRFHYATPGDCGVEREADGVSEPIEVNPAWRRQGGLALVCEKCLNVRFPEDFPEHAGDERLRLREWLKDRLKADGHWGAVRATGTTCLDVCAKGRVTIFLDPVGLGGAQRCLVFDPLADREQIYETIVRELAPRRAENLIG